MRIKCQLLSHINTYSWVSCQCFWTRLQVTSGHFHSLSIHSRTLQDFLQASYRIDQEPIHYSYLTIGPMAILTDGHSMGCPMPMVHGILAMRCDAADASGWPESNRNRTVTGQLPKKCSQDRPRNGSQVMTHQEMLASNA